MFNLSDSLGRPLFANIQVRATATRIAGVRSSYTPHPAPKISLVCEACLKTDEPEKCVSIQTRAAIRHSLSHSLCRFAGALTS